VKDGRRASVSKLPAELMRGLSPKRRELIRPVLERPRDYVLLSARKLAEALGADAMSVLRTIRGLGFDGCAEFRRYLHELALAEATQFDTAEPGSPGDVNISSQLRESLARDASNLAAFRRMVDLERVEKVGARLHDARRVVLLGGDLAVVLVKFLQYNLSVVDVPAVACTTPGEVTHGVRGLQKRDLVIAITFRRGLRQTVEGLQQARARGAYCVAITDTHFSPIARCAHEYFVASVESTPLYGVSYVAPMALLNTLLVACGATRTARTADRLKAADAEQRTGFRWYRDGQLGAGPEASPARRPRAKDGG
jgi:DNA-binding MurR/RpiR family transcriptional regulator